ncbi:hypothetical protein MTR67_037789 [Solanum verrucosum]|uniref:Endonuclease/exonuclease/phosphatase domain-containing protein n=1 Tax=Solanum verrucosum TaxID=315347 RepID=A0AAF0ZPL2_SOLVR|nr:hypothetical protein MTR67_037789 [Solanum verrucosum]
MLLNWKADVVCLQETKIEGNISNIVKEVWGSRWADFVQLEASGTRGEVVIIWEKRFWEGELSSVGEYSVSCSLSRKDQDFKWHLTGVYAPNDRVEREETWWELGAARGLFSGPWVLCGEFNTVRYPTEKRDGIRINRSMTEFSDFIEDMELIDIDLYGGKYTWKKGDRHTTAARLDRFLLSEEWDTNFSCIKQSVLSRVVSDHSPLLLQCGEWGQSNSYFKFENWWLHTEGFNAKVRDWWESFNYTGRPDYVLMAKLKALKGKLKEWRKTIQGNLKMQKANVLKQLADLEEIQEHRALEEREIASRLALTMEFEDIAKHEEIAWRQRSRALWLKQGDRNTSFFHRTANQHRRINSIDKLKVNGVEIAEPEEIKKEIVEYYERLYTESEEWRPQLDMRNYPRVDEIDGNFLEAPFEAEEILESIKACAGDKAPGPDGYTMVF